MIIIYIRVNVYTLAFFIFINPLQIKTNTNSLIQIDKKVEKMNKVFYNYYSRVVSIGML